MKRNKNEYFIGMVDTYSASKKYSKRKRRNKRKVFLKRGLVVLLCCAVIAALGALTYFVIAPAVGSLFSGSTADEATPDETTPDEVIVTTAPPTEPVTTVPATTAPKETEPAVTDADKFITPVIADDGKDGTLFSSTLYLYNGVGYNLFGSNDKVAKNYSNAVNDIAKGLDKKIKVYNMVVPNHTEFGLPTRIAKDIGCTSQADNIKAINKNLSSKIVPINCYNTLSAHNDEYIYYNTDHHWTSLGAYYAYAAFCEQTNQKPLDISKLNKNSISGFTGSFYTLSGSSALYNNADTVEYYDLPNKTSAQMKERMGSSTIHCDVYYPASTSGSLTYGVFCWGDTAQFVINSDAGTGKKIAVVKDSYGNAFAPYLTANYDEVHLLDFRYYSGDLNDYLKSNGIDEVLILNNTMSANSTSQVTTMKNALS